jgi:hypothetical protein
MQLVPLRSGRFTPGKVGSWHFDKRDYMVGTYPKRHAQMLAKVSKTPPKYPKSRAQMLAKVPKMPPKYPKCLGLSLLHATRAAEAGAATQGGQQGGAVLVDSP